MSKDAFTGAAIVKGAAADRFLELCYWSEEAGVLDIIRAVMALPPAARVALQTFLAAKSANECTVVVTFNPTELVIRYEE